MIRVRITAIGSMGEEDDSAVAILNEEGILIDGAFSDAVGISWADLVKVLETQYAMDRLQEAEASGF